MTEFAEMSGEQIKAEVFARLYHYYDRSAFEHYAIII